MASLFQSKNVAQNGPVLTPEGANDVVAVRAEYSLAAALVINDLIEMVVLPANCVPVDFILDADDLDTGTPTITFDVDLLAGTPGDTVLANRTIAGAVIFAASTVAQAGGLVRPTLVTALRIAPDKALDRSIGILVKAAPATGTTTGKIGLTMLYRPSINGA